MCRCCWLARLTSHRMRRQALGVWAEVHAAIMNWRQVALGIDVRLRVDELDDFTAAFEHEQMDAAIALLGH